MVIIAAGNTPLLIPNREVKIAYVNGTAICRRRSCRKTQSVAVVPFAGSGKTLVHGTR